MKKNYKKTVNQKIDDLIGQDDIVLVEKPIKRPFPLWAKIMIPLTAVGVACTAVGVYFSPAFNKNGPVISGVTKEKITFQSSRQNFYNIDTKIAKMNSLNTINYPQAASNFAYSEQELSGYLDFCYKMMKSIDYQSFSPANLYSVLNAIKGGVSDNVVLEGLTSLLGEGVNSSTLSNKIFKNNYYANNNGTTQIHNGAFFNNFYADKTPGYKYKQKYVNYLTDQYYEAYDLDFKQGVGGIVDWVNKALNSKDLIDEEFLEIQPDTALYLFSTLYFDHYWQYRYLKENNIVKNFTLKNKQEVEATFMKHDYIIQSYYDYDEYVSFDDYYFNGNKVTYLVAKSETNKDILDIVKDKNFLIEDENNKIVRGLNEEKNVYNMIFVSLTTPKFEKQNDIKFVDAISNLGLGLERLFAPYYDSLANCFEDPTDYFDSYIQTIKQRNNIKFNEDGSLLKTVVMAEIGEATSAAPHEDDGGDIYLNIDLCEPFIYIIKDKNNLPLFIGYMDNPN